jgi:fructose-1,6-bisphosphatase/inositol monophosphatase family enzyme
LSLVAIGAAEGFILPNFSNLCFPHWWDIASGILMVEEAGGKVTDFEGKLIKNHDLTKGLIASNGKIHNQLLNLVKDSYK